MTLRPDPGSLVALAGDDALEAVVRRVAAEIAPTAADLDASGAFPAANVAALYTAGLTNLAVARESGGVGAGLVACRRAVSEIARAEPSTALILAMHLVNHAMIRLGIRWPAALAERVVASSLAGPALINQLQVEAETGSPAYGALPHTRARRDGETWRLTGRKRFATGCEGLHWMVVTAVTDEAEPRVGTFVVSHDQPGIRIHRTWDTIGMRATGSHDVEFEGASVPLDDVLDLRPAAAGPPQEPRQGVWFMVLIGAVYQGIARAVRDEVAGFAASHVPVALGGPIGALPRIADEIGRIELLVEAGERQLDAAAAHFESGQADFLAAAAARTAVIEGAIEASNLALVVAGQAGIRRGSAFERHHRNALCGRTHGPNGATVRANAGRALLARMGL